jgi:hypothetical protein
MVDYVLKSKFKKYQIPLIKGILKIFSAEVNIVFPEDRPLTETEQKNKDFLYEKIQSLKREGLTKGEIIERFKREFNRYNMDVPSLPKHVYHLYDQ